MNNAIYSRAACNKVTPLSCSTEGVSCSSVPWDTRLMWWCSRKSRVQRWLLSVVFISYALLAADSQGDIVVTVISIKAHVCTGRPLYCQSALALLSARGDYFNPTCQCKAPFDRPWASLLWRYTESGPPSHICPPQGQCFRDLLLYPVACQSLSCVAIRRWFRGLEGDVANEAAILITTQCGGGQINLISPGNKQVQLDRQQGFFLPTADLV